VKRLAGPRGRRREARRDIDNGLERRASATERGGKEASRRPEERIESDQENRETSERKPEDWTVTRINLNVKGVSASRGARILEGRESSKVVIETQWT
jgi:hypothetical protein